MTSIKPTPDADGSDWRSAGLLYYRLSWYLRRKFGQPVWRVSVDGGLTCPNVDGTVGRGGCVFCDPRSFSPSRRHGGGAIADQISRSIERLRARKRIDCFLAYFQPATNTHAHPDRLRAIYEEAIGQPGIVGLIVGTRPDCVPEEVLDLLAEFSCRTWVSVEYGMQSSHDRSLRWMNRGHDYGVFRDAVERSLRRGLDVGGHVILGIPGESADDMRATAREVGRLGLRSVKLHNLYAVRDTRLAEQVESGSVRLPTLEEYVGYVVDFLELLPPWCVIDRLSGDAPNEYLLGPDWCRDKSLVRRLVEEELAGRGSWQGKHYQSLGC